MENIKVNINNKVIEYPKGITLEDISKTCKDEYKGIITLGVVDNKLRELNETIDKDCNIEFIDTSSEDGMRVYFRGLSFVFIRACEEILKGCNVTIEHSLSHGLYCEIKYERDINEEDIDKIENRMREIIYNNEPIKREIVSKEEAIDIFNNFGRCAKSELMKYKQDDSVKIYECGWLKSYFYGYMIPSTGYLNVFRLQYYKPGVVIMGPQKYNATKVRDFEPQPKLASVYREAENWSKLMNIDKVTALNEVILKENYSELIRTVEALHEKRISQIADIIASDENKRIILIAAPSSSGKTSFAHRLSVQLKVNNLHPIPISLDDYFVDRESTPKDDEGNYDFESIYAIDIDLFNSDLEKLLNGEEVELPTFNFKTGNREYNGRKLKLNENQPIILEGIHGLNPLLTQSIPDENKFKIYISVLTQINLDDHNRIPTTDLRLLRRIVRDYNFRGYSAQRTIVQWPSVRRGEEKNIFPFQEEADIMFNSASLYELAVLKKYAEPILKEIEVDSREYREANRLLKFLQYFVSLEDEHDIPPTSIIREFIGGSRIVH